MKRKIVAVVLAAGVALGLTACDKGSNDPSMRPFVTVAPSGKESVCTWDPGRNRTTGEWECEQLK